MPSTKQSAPLPDTPKTGRIMTCIGCDTSVAKPRFIKREENTKNGKRLGTSTFAHKLSASFDAFIVFSGKMSVVAIR